MDREIGKIMIRSEQVACLLHMGLC